MDEQRITGIQVKIREMAGRIREMRKITGFSASEMAKRTGVSEEEYVLCETGQSDLNIAFLYRCALTFGVDVTDLIEGRSPTLRSYTLTRAGTGQKIEQAHHMTYYNLASDFQNRSSLPLYVVIQYSSEAEHEDIELTTHEGQECDLVISGQMKIQIGEHTEILNAGDSIYYDSSTPHGMIALGGEDCCFYAIVLDPVATATGKEQENPADGVKPVHEHRRTGMSPDHALSSFSCLSAEEAAFFSAAISSSSFSEDLTS